MKKILLLLALPVFLLGIGKPRNLTLRVPDFGDTLKATFVPLDIAGGDQELCVEMLRRMNAGTLEGEKYIDAKIIAFHDNSTIKILNLYGEVTGGATYNPFAVFYIIRGNTISDVALAGEIFRADFLKIGKVLLYNDDFGRLGSNFKVYETTFSRNGLLGLPTSKHGNYLFNCLTRKEHIADSLPYPRIKTDENLLSYLGLDTVRLAANSYYWYDEERFLDRISSRDDNIEPVVYFRSTKGDILEKVLVIGHGKNAVERVLARRADDPHERLSTVFINDSIVKQYNVSTETAEELESLIAYETDSTVTEYKYDGRFNITEKSKVTYHYRLELVSENNALKLERRISFGNPIKINGQSVRWKYIREYPYHGKRREKVSDMTYELIDTISGKSILQAVRSPLMPNYEGAFDETANFTDVNLDGYADFKLYNGNASGSAGNFEDVYLYDPKRKTFAHSKDFSGYDLVADSKSRTVTTFGKSGYWNFSIRTVHLDAKSTVLFVELFTCDEKEDVLTLRYRKVKGKKLLAEKSKDIPIDEIGSREAAEAELLNLR